MSLIGLLVVLVIAALLIWATNRIVPAIGLPANIATIITVIVTVLVVLWLLSAVFGGGLPAGIRIR